MSAGGYNTPGRVFVVRYAYGQAANEQELEDAARQVVASYQYTALEC